MKINADFQRFAAVSFDPLQYKETATEGVARLVLDQIGDELARATLIVQCKPKARFPAHIHHGGEEFLVLEGSFKDEYGEYEAGTYVRNLIGSQHAPWVGNEGCTVFVKLLQMTANGDDTNGAMRVNLESAKLDQGQPASYGTLLELYRSRHSGEVVEMCWLEPGAIILPHHDQSNDSGGEELFIVDGSLCLGDDCYGKWGWIRFPAGSHHDHLFQRHPVVAGKLGAQVMRKTGHLTSVALSMEKVQIHDDD